MGHIPSDGDISSFRPCIKYGRSSGVASERYLPFPTLCAALHRLNSWTLLGHKSPEFSLLAIHSHHNGFYHPPPQQKWFETGAYTLTLKGIGMQPLPSPAFFPSWWNVRQKSAIATLCVLCDYAQRPQRNGMFMNSAFGDSFKDICLYRNIVSETVRLSRGP
jgi:hypothetical protein